MLPLTQFPTNHEPQVKIKGGGAKPYHMGGRSSELIETVSHGIELDAQLVGIAFSLKEKNWSIKRLDY